MMTLSFLTFGGLSILTKKMGGKDNTNMHGYLMFAASVTASFGAYVIYDVKETYKKAHLTSSHGQWGAAVLSIFILYPVTAWVLYNPQNGWFSSNKLARKLHKYSGKAIILGGLISCCLGVFTMEKDSIKAWGLIGTMMAATPFFLL